MIKLNDMKMKPKLTILFLVAGILPLALVGWWSSRLATDALMERSYGQLENARQIKKAQIRLLKDDPYVMNALIEFDRVFEDAGDQVNTSEWNALAEKYDQRMQDIVTDNDWYDLFLIHTDGDIVYTVRKESDLGMIITG